MGRTYGLNPGRRCDYGGAMRNLWALPLGRLERYCQPFDWPGGSFKVSPQASCLGPEWIGVERYFALIEETIPFRRLSPADHGRLLWQQGRGPLAEIERTACVLIDHLNTTPNFFHWFLDALPRLFAAEAYEQRFGLPCHIVLPQTLRPWQWDSLRFLAVPQERLIAIPDAPRARGFGLANLVSTFSHRHIRHSPTGHFDACSADTIRLLSDRLFVGSCSAAHPPSPGQRLYISRGGVSHRRVRNEDAVMEVLSPHGFQRVCLDQLCLRDQIHLFRGASHVIAAHGGALTNLLHISPGCQVLEVFQAGHGPRPEFFQLAAIRGATYSFCTAASLNARHDIEIAPAQLRTFLEASL
ncbi:MAG: glycosyltransferase 61 family protein [Cyanobacteriota bacterium]|nr:glycosyltransferase 61 family protein [Cyanobacteriota bacterium]